MHIHVIKTISYVMCGMLSSGVMFMESCMKMPISISYYGCNCIKKDPNTSGIGFRRNRFLYTYGQ